MVPALCCVLIEDLHARRVCCPGGKHGTYAHENTRHCANRGGARAGHQCGEQGKLVVSILCSNQRALSCNSHTQHVRFDVRTPQDQFTALIDAVRMEQLEIAQLLLDHGALLEGAGEVRPALSRSLLAMRSLCNTGNCVPVILPRVSQEQWSALIVAAMEGRLKSVEWLLTKGASVHTRNAVSA
jgi:ankyrin repeat protein